MVCILTQGVGVSHRLTFQTASRLVLIPELSKNQSQEARHWLMLAVSALGIAGIFALLLVASRTPGVSALFPWTDFFRTALVIHVDQSVLVWFLCMAGLVAAIAPSENYYRIARLGTVLALIGMLLLALSAFGEGGPPLMNNYVPVLQRPIFFAALIVFSVGILLQLLSTSFKIQISQLIGVDSNPISIALVSITFAFLVALLSLCWTALNIPHNTSGLAYYEILFWGAGHSLQFGYSQLLILCWLLMASACNLNLGLKKSWLHGLFFLGVAPLLWVFVIFLLHAPASADSHQAYSELMKYAGGFPAIIFSLLIFVGLVKRRDRVTASAKPLVGALWMSVLLFGSGGMLALFISGSNTLIPAHYHGSIVGITLALMGLAYLIMPRLGYVPIEGNLATAQPILYGVGQLMHIGGLAASGVLGIKRKTAGAEQGLDSLAAKTTMGVMGIGGLLAVIGGVLFVWIMVRAFWGGRRV